MASSRVFLLFGLVFAVLLLVSSYKAAARELIEVTNSSQSVEEYGHGKGHGSLGEGYDGSAHVNHDNHNDHDDNDDDHDDDDEFDDDDDDNDIHYHDHGLDDDPHDYGHGHEHHNHEGHGGHGGDHGKKHCHDNCPKEEF